MLGWLKKRLLRRKLNQLEKESIMLQKLKEGVDWLTDPKYSGRKRGIAAALLTISVMVRAGHEAIQRFCAAGDLSNGICLVEPGGVIDALEIMGTLVMTLEPGMTTFGILMAGWGIYDARKKDASR